MSKEDRQWLLREMMSRITALLGVEPGDTVDSFDVASEQLVTIRITRVVTDPEVIAAIRDIMAEFKPRVEVAR